MQSFTLQHNAKNLRIAEIIRACTPECKIEVTKKAIAVTLKYGLSLSLLDLSMQGVELTDSEWRALFREIKSTLQGGKARMVNPGLISISPLKTELLTIRITPLEKKMIEEAAKLQHKTVARFIREALASAAGEIFDAETARKMAEKTGNAEERGYVA